MHLLLGHADDPCCLIVRGVLEARGYPVQTISNPLAHPSRFSWRLDETHCASAWSWNGEGTISGDRISGVLVRNAGWIDPEGWLPKDLMYMQAETQAALLGWLWSLPAPVVNRYPASFWYRPRPPLLSWYGKLRRSGLRIPETLLTNVEEDARAFRRGMENEGVPGAVYGPLTNDARYLIVDERDWSGLASMQAYTPTCIEHPHGAAQPACIAGGEVIWEGAPSREAVALEPLLLRFARQTGLSLLEIVLAPAGAGLCVIAVEPQPNLQHFGDEARARIGEAIADLLTGNGNFQHSAHAGFAEALP